MISPHAVDSIACTQDADFVYFVTEYVPGGTLEHLLLHFQRWNKTKLVWLVPDGVRRGYT